MTLLSAIRTLIRSWRSLVTLPVLAAVATAFVMGRQAQLFLSSSVLYTGIVSGYGIESGQGSRSDHLAIGTAFDNLINLIQTRETLESVALRLLADDLAQGNRVAEATLDAVQIDAAVRPPQESLSSDEILDRLLNARDRGDPELVALMANRTSPYGATYISEHLEPRRIGGSDMLRIAYTTENPHMAARTLTFVLEELSQQYRALKTQETSAVIDYFETATAAANLRLQEAVVEMRDFGVENRVINYYEQTKYIASEKESIDHELQLERMQLSAAKAALAEVEEKLKSKQELYLKSTEVTAARRDLARLTARSALAEAGGASDPGLQAEIVNVRGRLSNNIEELFSLTHSKEGLSREDLSRAWLKQLLAVDESEARLEVLERRREQYARTYDVFAPLGSGLSSLEREVDVAENEYLEMLHSLNQARMRQQNVDMSAQLAVVDPPNLPTEPLPSARTRLVLLSWLATTVLLIGVLFGIELLDRTLRSPQRARAMTGLRIAGVLPTAPDDHPVADALDSQLARNVKLSMYESGREDIREASLITVFGMTVDDGAHVVAQRLGRRLEAEGDTVHMVRGQEGNGPGLRVERADAPTLEPPDSRGEVTIFEVPDAVRGALRLDFLRRSATVLVVVRADRTWSDADRTTLEALVEGSRVEPRLVLTHARNEALEASIGQLPKARSAPRRLAKRLATLELIR